jgi:transposase
VLTPDIYDPTLNPLYCDVLAHYGAVALPCRVRDPDRKGKVESAIGGGGRQRVVDGGAAVGVGDALADRGTPQPGEHAAEEHVQHGRGQRGVEAS